MGDCTMLLWGTVFLLFCLGASAGKSQKQLSALSMTAVSLLGVITYILSFLMVTLLLHGVFTPELAHPGACHSSEGKCPGLLAVNQC